MKRNFLKGTIISLAALAIGSAAYAETKNPHGAQAASADSNTSRSASSNAAKSSPGKASGHGSGSGWAYSGDNGPERWGRLAREYAACGQGTAQSPVDLTSSAPAGAPVGNIDFNYRLTPIRILNNGHTVQVNYTPGSSMAIEGQKFELLQFHFHSPSEHAVNGQLADMELHMVHRNAAGKLAVIGVLLNIGEENLALSEIWQNLPKGEAAEREYKRSLINARDFLPANAEYYRYMGSLTTPPCTEGVNWFVMTTPLEVSREQVDSLVAAVGHNNRPIQSVNNRLLLAPATN